MTELIGTVCLVILVSSVVSVSITYWWTKKIFDFVDTKFDVVIDSLVDGIEEIEEEYGSHDTRIH